MLLNSKENDERAGREGDSFCSENVKFAWKVWTLGDIFGPFHADTVPFNQKLRLLCFPPRNMDVYPKQFFSAKPTGLFSRCQIGCHGNLKELRDDG